MLYYNTLEHHGIEGQKWGVRRYQYEDGSLTPEGKKRYHLHSLNSEHTGHTGHVSPSTTAKAIEKTSKDYARTRSTTLTSDELKTAIERMQLERDYMDKTNAVSIKKRVLAKMGDTLLETSAKLLSSTVTKIITTKVDSFVKKHVADKDDDDDAGKDSKKSKKSQGGFDD